MTSYMSLLYCTDWPCRLPMCEKNRLRLEDGVYDFCSRNHKVEFGKAFCVRLG